MKPDKNWQAKALAIIDEYRFVAHDQKLTQKVLAAQVGVSRQTLWRNEEIRTRFNELSAHTTHEIKDSRRTLSFRLARLEYELAEARDENNRLIEVIVHAAGLLSDDGLDAKRYFDEPPQ